MAYVTNVGYATVGDFVMVEGETTLGQPPPVIVGPQPPAPVIVRQTAGGAPPPPKVIPGPPMPVIVKGKIKAGPPMPVIVPGKKPGLLARTVAGIKRTISGRPTPPPPRVIPAAQPPAPVIVQNPSALPTGAVLPAKPITGGRLPTATQFTGRAIGGSATAATTGSEIAPQRPTPSLVTQGSRPQFRTPVAHTPVIKPRAWGPGFMTSEGL